MDEFITFITNLRFWTIISPLLMTFLIFYLREKGKNTATKEDVGKITKEIEKVKHEYSSKLESVKTILSARLFTHQVRYQNEFDMLVNLSEKLYKFKTALDNFKFQIASFKSGGDDIDSIRQSAEKVVEALGAMMDEYEAHLPFYPQDIYDSVTKLHSLGISEFIVELDKVNLTQKGNIGEIIVELSKNRLQDSEAEKLSKVIERINKAIRKRVEYWEQLDIN